MHFHRDHCGDSWGIVTPFVQDRSYLSRNFATFRRSELPPSLAGASIHMSVDKFSSPFSAGQESRSILPNKLAERCVFDKQSLPTNFISWSFKNQRAFIETGTPYPEVTGCFCRIPSQWFARTLLTSNQPTCVGFKYGLFFVKVDFFHMMLTNITVD